MRAGIGQHRAVCSSPMLFMTVRRCQRKGRRQILRRQLLPCRKFAFVSRRNLSAKPLEQEEGHE